MMPLSAFPQNALLRRLVTRKRLMQHPLHIDSKSRAARWAVSHQRGNTSVTPIVTPSGLCPCEALHMLHEIGQEDRHFCLFRNAPKAPTDRNVCPPMARPQSLAPSPRPALFRADAARGAVEPGPKRMLPIAAGANVFQKNP
jgi:hypothetical protein